VSAVSGILVNGLLADRKMCTEVIQIVVQVSPRLLGWSSLFFFAFNGWSNIEAYKTLRSSSVPQLISKDFLQEKLHWAKLDLSSVSSTVGSFAGCG
jgi:hypothetical protein